MYKKYRTVISGITYTTIEYTNDLGQISFIPEDLDNTDYQKCLIWVSQGNVLTDKLVSIPTIEKQLSVLELLDLFTEAEQLAVVTAAMSVPQVKLWYDRMLAASYVTISDPRTVGGLQALVAYNLITETRKNAIIQAMS